MSSFSFRFIFVNHNNNSSQIRYSHSQNQPRSFCRNPVWPGFGAIPQSMASAPSNKIERAHQLYREGRYEDALGLYTEALAMAKTNPQKIALHSNRAACFLKLHRFNKVFFSLLFFSFFFPRNYFLCKIDSLPPLSCSSSSD